MAVSVRPKPKSEVIQTSKYPESSSSLNCVVAKGTRIEGHFKSSENMRLDGVVVGDVFCDKKLVLGETGKVEGTLNSLDAVIMGHVVGELKVSGVLHLNSSANIEGDITAKKMIVEEGARYNGACKIG